MTSREELAIADRFEKFGPEALLSRSEIKLIVAALRGAAQGQQEPVVWRVLCTTNGATGYLYTEQLPFDPGCGVRVREEPEPLYTGFAQAPSGRYVHIDNVVYHLDDIEVDKDVKCAWTEVANALTHIKLCIEHIAPPVSSTDQRAQISGTESCTCHFFGAGEHHVPGCPHYSVVTSNMREDK